MASIALASVALSSFVTTQKYIVSFIDILSGPNNVRRYCIFYNDTFDNSRDGAEFEAVNRSWLRLLKWKRMNMPTV